MKHPDLKKISKSKGKQLNALCEYIGYTRAGLKPALENETIELRKIKSICKFLNISPLLFFEDFDFTSLKISDNELINYQKNEIEYLKKILIDKEFIINLLNEKFK